jgi:hypothetical protein
MKEAIPEPYAPFAHQVMSAAKTTNALDVAQAIWLAATDGSKRLRYAAGPDAEDVAAMRRALPGEDYLEQMRAALGPASGPKRLG